MRKAIMSIMLALSLISLIQPVKANTDTIITQEQRTTLDKYGYKIVIKDEIEDTGEWGFNPAGLFDPNTKTIYLDSEYISWAWNHEMGHMANYSKNNISQTDKFKEIFNEEKEGLFNDDYFKKSTDEYFAESYKYYLEQPQLLKDKAPKTFDYIQKIKF